MELAREESSIVWTSNKHQIGNRLKQRWLDTLDVDLRVFPIFQIFFPDKRHLDEDELTSLLNRG